MCSHSIEDNHNHFGINVSRREFITKTTSAAAFLSLPGLVTTSVFGSNTNTPSYDLDTVGYATKGSGEHLKKFHFKRRTLNADDVLIKIHYCGICHSDIHSAQAPLDYTLVPGHEITGKVVAAGNSVTKFKVGDSAGIGCMVGSCGTCEYCKRGEEQYCNNPGFTFTAGKGPGGSTSEYGGYSDKIVVKEKFVIKIPAGMDLAAAAPLLCAGITTFSPMEHWNIGKDKKVGVLGLGGLGHLAVKLFAARGAEVTVFTTTKSKKADAIRMGAKDVYLWEDEQAFKENMGKYDYLLSTVPDAFKINPFLPLLKVDGTFINVGTLGPEMEFNNAPLALGRRSMTASVAGGLKETQDMIDYCFKNKIYAQVEMIKPEQINEAFKKVVNKEARYRYVIDAGLI